MINIICATYFYMESSQILLKANDENQPVCLQEVHWGKVAPLASLTEHSSRCH